MRNRLLISVFGVLLFVGLAGCSGADGENASGGEVDDELSDELIIFNWNEYMPDEILEGFEEEFGVDIVYSTFSSNQEMLAKIKSGTVPYDIAFPSASYMERIIEEGLLNEINFDNIPNFKNIADEWKSQDFDPDNKYSVAYLAGTTGIIYNKSKISTPPTSWEDLWNPEYNGRVMALEGPDEINWMLQQYIGSEINDPTVEQIEEGGDVFKELVPNIFKFSEVQKAEFVNGEAWISLGYSGEAGLAYLENEDIDFVLPEEGGFKWSDNMVIPNTSQNQATAEAFINYVLRPEVSKLLSEEFVYTNPNEAAFELLDEEDQNIPGLNMTPEQLENTESTTTIDAERTQVINEVIQEAIVAGGH